MALTDITISNLPVPDRSKKLYADGLVPGLFVRVAYSGTKTFVLVQGKARRYHTLGVYGVLSLVQARAAARRLIAEKTLGRIIPPSVSLSEAREEYLAFIDVRPNTMESYKRYLSYLEGPKLADCTTQEVNRVLRGLTNSSAEIALWTYKAFFKWCLRQNYLERSPCELIQVRAKTKPRRRVLNDRELRAVWNACDQLGQYGTIVRLLILTGCRPREISRLRAQWIEGEELTLPAAICKNKNEATLPLGKLALSLLPAKQDLLFPSVENPKVPFDNWWDAKRQIDKILEENVAPWQLRDLRRTYRTLHGRIGTAPHLAERLINHVSAADPIQRVYDRHNYFAAMREAVEKYENFLIKEILRSP